MVFMYRQNCDLTNRQTGFSKGASLRKSRILQKVVLPDFASLSCSISSAMATNSFCLAKMISICFSKTLAASDLATAFLLSSSALSSSVQLGSNSDNFILFRRAIMLLALRSLMISNNVGSNNLLISSRAALTSSQLVGLG